MGNDNCCASDRKPRKTTFTESERDILKKLFARLSDKKVSMDPNGLSQNSLTSLFPENPEVGVGLYNFMKRNTLAGHIIEYDIFEAAVEVLLKDPVDYQYKDYKNLEKIDILALLICSKKDGGRDELKGLTISHADAVKFIKTILKVFQTNNKTFYTPSDVEAKSIVDGVFTSQQAKVSWWDFLTHVKSQLTSVNPVLKAYFTTKFLGTPFAVKLPEFSRPSVVIHNDGLALLYLSNTSIQSSNKLELLYSSKGDSHNFVSLASALKGYSGATLILAKVSPKELTTVSREFEVFNVIGAFTKSQWKDGGVYHGDYDTYIFSMVPKFKNFHSIHTQTAVPNFQYLNSTGTNGAGIGFGGNHKNDFRLWFDASWDHNNFVNKSDNTFVSGDILNDNHSVFRIDDFEVWGVGATTATSSLDNIVMRSSTIGKSIVNPEAQEEKKNLRVLEARISELTKKSSAPLKESTTAPVQTTGTSFEELRKSMNLPSTIITGTNLDELESQALRNSSVQSGSPVKKEQGSNKFLEDNLVLRSSYTILDSDKDRKPVSSDSPVIDRYSYLKDLPSSKFSERSTHGAYTGQYYNPFDTKDNETSTRNTAGNNNGSGTTGFEAYKKMHDSTEKQPGDQN